MPREECRGQICTVYWAELPGGACPGREYYLEKLTEREQARAVALFRRYADLGQIWNKQQFNHEGDGIYAFKPGNHRFVCFLRERDAIVTHGYKKQGDKMPRREFARAIEIRKVCL